MQAPHQFASLVTGLSSANSLEKEVNSQMNQELPNNVPRSTEDKLKMSLPESKADSVKEKANISAAFEGLLPSFSSTNNKSGTRTQNNNHVDSNDVSDNVNASFTSSLATGNTEATEKTRDCEVSSNDKDWKRTLIATMIQHH